MIERYLKYAIQQSLRFFPAVGILGPRQVGKTTLVKQLVNELPKPSLYFDLELPDDYQTLSQNAAWVIDNNRDKTIIIDEVQRLLSIFPPLRGLIDRDRQPGRFVLLGSASLQFLQKSSESLAGRIAYHELMPLQTVEARTAQISTQTLWFRGGFPDALLAPNDDFWYLWHQNFIKTYIEQDLSALGINAPSVLLNNFLRMLAHNQGSLLNYSTLGNSLGISHTTVQRYIAVLEQAYLVRRLEPWFVNVSKRIVKSPKLYLIDSGSLHFLHNLRTQAYLVQHPIVGASWEGFVIEQIIRRLKNGVSPYFYRTSNGAEMDLVLVEGIKPIVAIEIKLSLAPALKRGSTESARDLGTSHHFVVTPQGGNLDIRPHWIHCNVEEVIDQLISLGLVEPHL
ncbi:MAG: ATP-binding protein [Runella slithyformis]|nr:MAG: ATP-binding protein [Runella slithyformis]TAF47792.1 MAG: ATP-binding protein [Runella slithyformis]